MNESAQEVCIAIPVHPEAPNLVNALQFPELLEIKTLKEIKHMFSTSAYADTGDFADTTMGWAGSVDQKGAKPGALLVVKAEDGRETAIALGMGRRGNYYISTIVKNTSDPTDDERASLQSYKLPIMKNFYTRGPKFQQLLDAYGTPSKTTMVPAEASNTKSLLGKLMGLVGRGNN